MFLTGSLFPSPFLFLKKSQFLKNTHTQTFKLFGHHGLHEGTPNFSSLVNPSPDVPGTAS